MRRFVLAPLSVLAVLAAILVSCDKTSAPADGTSVSDGSPVASDGAPVPSDGAPAPSFDVPTCTRIVGMSQTRQWYLASFETVAPDDHFELYWTGGAAISSWARPGAWESGTLESPCATGAPTRVIIDVGVGDEILDDEELYTSYIRTAVEMARTRFPGAEIGLQPLVGGPGYRTCSIVYHGVTYDVHASVAAPQVAAVIDELIAQDPTIFRGPDPQLASCDMYRDPLGHLTITTRDGSVTGQDYAGGVIGEFYAGSES